MHQERIWSTAVHDEARARLIAEQFDLPLPAAVVLAGRGFSEREQIEQFLSPRLSRLCDPFLLPDMERAVARIWSALDRRERVVVYGDYDVDGITASALLIKTLRALGATVEPFLPLRLEEGYGLSPDGLARCIEAHRPSLIVTVDCGTGSVEAVKSAAAAGIDVIVTDHHTPSEEMAPALAVVNPKLGRDEPAKVLAGVGVAFKLCHALLKHRRDAAKDFDLKKLLDLVALGTISDIVPLTDENRIVARHGLSQLNRTSSVGLRALADAAGVRGRIDTYEVGFRLGPRLNAAGRLGDALNALDLLLTDSVDRARDLAAQLDASNRERQDIERQIVDDVMTELDARFRPDKDFGLVVAREGWHAGVIGIVASRIVQRFHRPVACIGLDGKTGRGSCRGIEGFDMVAGLHACADLLLKFGGHAMAAGLEIEAVKLEDFGRRFNEAARASLANADLRPVQKVDAWLGLGEADDRLLRALEAMKPFGYGNPTPVWASRGLSVVGPPKTVGKGHLKLVVAQGGVQREAMGWNMADREIPDGTLDLAFQLKKDAYLGHEKIVLSIQDLRPSP